MVDISNPECLPPCSGLILTSFSKYKEDKNLPSLISDEVNEYDRYLKWSPLPPELNGFLNVEYSALTLIVPFYRF